MTRTESSRSPYLISSPIFSSVSGKGVGIAERKRRGAGGSTHVSREKRSFFSPRLLRRWQGRWTGWKATRADKRTSRKTMGRRLKEEAESNLPFTLTRASEEDGRRGVGVT